MPQSVLGDSVCKLYYDRSVITYPTIHNYRPDQLYLTNHQRSTHARARAHTHTHTHTHIRIYTAITNSHNLHSTATLKLLKYTELKEELSRLWRLKTTYVLLLALPTTGIIPNKLHESFKPLKLLPVLYILTQKAVALNTCLTVRTLLAKQSSKCLVSESCTLLRTS